MRYNIFESATGDELGYILIDPEDLEKDPDVVIRSMINTGYLPAENADHFTVDAGYSFLDPGSVVILDDRDEPVLTLEPDEEDDDAEDEEPDDDSDPEV